MKEKQNQEVNFPKRYYAKHFCSGVAGYLDENFLVPQDAMKAMNPTFEGKPVFLGHMENSESRLGETDGWVIKSFYNEVDGWLWCEFIVTTERAQDAIDAGTMAVSNAYVPAVTRGAGIYNGLAYDRELVEGIFTHLALVPNPRYKESIILSPDDFKVYQESKRNELKQLKNSVEEKQNKEERKTKTMFKLFKKVEVENSDDVMKSEIQLEDGTSIAIADMIKEVQNSREAEKANEEAKEKEKEETKVNMDMKVPVGDVNMTLKELIDAYTSNKKENADEEDTKKEDKTKPESSDDAPKAKDNEDTEEEEKKKEKDNSEDSKTEKMNADKKAEEENSKYMDALENAGELKNGLPILNIQTSQGAVELGKSRYGSPK